MLLVRALVCLFWKRPFESSLVRWGTALHDRFMLPHFVERDFAEVLSELAAGLASPSTESWFAAQREFRFPKIGSINGRGLELGTCAMRLSPGTCSPKRPPREERCAA